MSAYELRTYQIAPGMMAAIEDVMKELVQPLMPDYAMQGVGFWATPDESTLYWIVRHESIGAIQSDWDRFHADQRWSDGMAKRQALEPIVTSVATVSLVSRRDLPPSDCL